MTTDNKNGHLAASRIEVEPTVIQKAAHELTQAFGSQGEIDWTVAEANFQSVNGFCWLRVSVYRGG